VKSSDTGHVVSDDAVVREVGRLIEQGARRTVDVDTDADGRARFVARVCRERRAGTPRREPRAIVVVLAAALATVLAVSLWMLIPRRHVTYAVDGTALASGGFVQAPANADASVHFSDGSVVVLSPGTRGRVREVRERGARFTIETGTADVHVAKREGGADYIIEAGPYAVKVIGTRFTVAWDPSGDHLHLDLAEGSVVITGPLAENGVGLRAGQIIDLDASGVRVHESSTEHVTAASTSGDAVDASPATAEAVASSDAAPSASSTSAAPRGATWATEVAAGDYDAVLRDVDARGVAATLESVGAGELMTLADAARYGGRPGLANDALRAVRRRFPGTKPASTAAFLLERMAEDGGRVDAALSLYDATLSEGGTFAAEALGRKMMLVKRRSGDGAATPIARQYLSAFPRGAYADAARALVSSP